MLVTTGRVEMEPHERTSVQCGSGGAVSVGGASHCLVDAVRQAQGAPGLGLDTASSGILDQPNKPRAGYSTGGATLAPRAA